MMCYLCKTLGRWYRKIHRKSITSPLRYSVGIQKIIVDELTLLAADMLFMVFVYASLTKTPAMPIP